MSETEIVSLCVEIILIGAICGVSLAVLESFFGSGR